jgi:Tfp pilus assembly protein PilF
MAQSWKTVRVFISSTFRDMHAERDHLVKVVFPELHERMAGRHLNLVDIDLRWGITEQQAEQGKALEICLEEIERSRPFFIGMLGERYGSLLGSASEDAELDHPWLKDHEGHSLTALEITHAVLRNPELARRAFFYFRDPSFIARMPEPVRADYASEDEQAASKLAKLKAQVRSSGRPVLENYSCRWDETQKRVVDLDAFGERVLEDLWQAICAEYPVEAAEPDPLTMEREAHEAFAEERSRLHVGRENEAKQLSEYVEGSDRRPALITGESGCGKSAFLASWSHHYASEHPDDLVLPYFVGASPSSTGYRRLLRTICGELTRELALEEEVPEADEKLPDTLAIFLQAASRKRGRVVLVIDALDQLSPIEGAHGLGWLLDYIPEQTRLVVSTLEGDCLDALHRRRAEEIALPPLGAKEQRQIVETVLGEWRRKLDTPQLAALLDHPGVSSPLYLRVALEELRLFGRFEQLLPQIDGLAADVAGLFDQALERLEQDHGRELVTEAFSLLGSSRYGLSEAELLDLLRREGEEQLPRALWARLARGAKAYLVEHGELVGFFHRQLAEAVTARYLRRETKHATLAAFFGQAPLERRLDEFPYQLQQAEEWQALSAALSDLDFFEQACDHEREHEWMGYWRSLEGRFEPGACYQAALDRRIEAEGQSEAVARSAAVIGGFLRDMGRYPSALPFMERSLAIDERALGLDHPDVAASLNNLAALYQNQGEYARALPLFERALTIWKRALGPGHLHVAASLNNLAGLHHDQGEYARAQPLYERSLVIRERALGPDHPEVARSLSNLAGLYRTQGDYTRALPLYERALAIWERTLGPDHPQVATGLNGLARCYQGQADYARAQLLLQRAVAILERALGPDHPDVAQSLNNLASLSQDQGDYIGALPLYERSLAIDERALGPDHPHVAAILNNLAGLYRTQGDYAHALPLFQRSLAIVERALGPDHPDVAASLNNLAGLYRAQGDYVHALPLYERSLAISERALGPDHPEVATSLNNLAVLYEDQGEHVRALPLYERSLVIRERALGPDHPQVATSLNNLAELFRTKGENARALPLYERSLAIEERALGADHPKVATSLNNLALLYEDQGDHARALPLFERSLVIRERALGADHPQVATSLTNLAALYQDQGDYARALPLYERAVAIAEATLGSDNPRTQVLRKNMEACRASEGGQGGGQTQAGPASGPVGGDGGELALVLIRHLQRIRTNYPELDAFVSQYFGDADVAKIATAAAGKLRLTQADGEQHSTVLERGEVVYHITTLPVDMGQAKEWFGRTAGGYTKFLGDVWDSLLPKTTASVWCHVIYGSSAGRTWVHMAVCAVRQPAPIGVMVMPVELLTPEERKAIGV